MIEKIQALEGALKALAAASHAVCGLEEHGITDNWGDELDIEHMVENLAELSSDLKDALDKLVGDPTAAKADEDDSPFSFVDDYDEDDEEEEPELDFGDHTEPDDDFNTIWD